MAPLHVAGKLCNNYLIVSQNLFSYSCLLILCVAFFARRRRQITTTSMSSSSGSSSMGVSDRDEYDSRQYSAEMSAYVPNTSGRHDQYGSMAAVRPAATPPVVPTSPFAPTGMYDLVPSAASTRMDPQGSQSVNYAAFTDLAPPMNEYASPDSPMDQYGGAAGGMGNYGSPLSPLNNNNNNNNTNEYMPASAPL